MVDALCKWCESLSWARGFTVFRVDADFFDLGRLLAGYHNKRDMICYDI